MTTLEEFRTTFGECMTTLGESRNTLGECRTAMGECMNTLGRCRTDQFISLLILCIYHIFYQKQLIYASYFLFQPEIEVSKGTIYSQPGSNVTLSCFITGEIIFLKK